MAIQGNRFLKVSNTRYLEVTDHARERITQYTGITPSLGDAYRWFKAATQIKPGELFQMGYRPAYHPRKKNGVESWYFKIKVLGFELIAVIQQGEDPRDIEWVTTYAPNKLSHARREQIYQFHEAIGG